MKKLLITGLNGTLAPKLAVAARAAGLEVIGWDREAIAAAASPEAEQWLAETAPDAIAHLAMGDPAWAGLLARHAAERGLPMVFTSTAMVFDPVPDGPHGLHDERTGKDDYGRYKIACEDAVRAANAAASVVRIGWQIDPDGRGNNMLAALDEWQRREGKVAASRAWLPACSFMEDTAQALLRLLITPAPGLVHLDSNAGEGHRFDAIVAALRERFGRDDWRLETHEDYRHDQRLRGGEALMPGLSERLPRLL